MLAHLRTLLSCLLLVSIATPNLWAQTKSTATAKADAKKETPAPKKEAYRYTVRIKELKDTVCYLAYHMGDKQYVADTARVDSKGEMFFTGSETLDPGIYMIVLPNRKYFEFLLTETKMTIETDTTSMNEHLKITGSKDNEVFLQYINYVGVKGKKINELVAQYKEANAKKNTAEAQRLSAEVKKEEDALADYRRKTAAEHKGTFISTLLLALTDPIRPEPPKASNGRPDSAWKFYDSRAHYFDNIDFSDARLIRTPILLAKVKNYLDNMTVVDPDSINKSADLILDKAEVNKEVFRYLLWYISNTYETSKYMGMDAVFVHVSKRYYLAGKATWLDSATLKKISDRVKVLDPLLIGKQAPRLVVRDTLSHPVSLYDVASKHKYTVVIFYDPNCGHCQKEVPEIHEHFYKEYKPKGVEVMAVCAERNSKDWRNFVRKHKLSFINAFDADTVVDFRNWWDVYSFPVIYIIDQEKKIVAKRVGSAELGKFIDENEKIRQRIQADKAKKEGAAVKK
jgi:peroxiredoxin